jgi:hypothetical protein
MNSFSISKIARSLAIFTITLFVLGSCEKKESTIGSGFLDGEKFGSGIYRNTKIIAYTKEKENVITSGTGLNLIGAYKDPNFGMIKSSFGIQLALSEEDPDFGTNAKIDSVVLTMPYLGRVQGDSLIVYDTDSIYGKKDIPMSFKISQLSGFLHPDSTFYSDIKLKKSVEIYNNPSFTFSPDSIILTRLDTTDTGADTTIVSKIPAAFREKLDEKYFQTNIIDLNKDGNSSPLLYTNTNFITNHINGFVFETESTDGAVYSFNMFNKTSLIIYYKNDDLDEDGKPLPQQKYQLLFNKKLTRVNSYEFDKSSADASLIAQIDPGYDTTVGSDIIYLQGMSGLQANIKLFTDSMQLDTLRRQGWLINRAELVYRVSDDNGNVVAPPFRLMMGNSDSLKVAGADYRMIDYLYEPVAFDGYLNNDATMLSGGVEKRYYKFRITNHIANILDGEIIMNDKGEYEVVYDDTKNYVIKLVSFSGSESVSRVKINSSNNTMDPAKNLFLEIHYSKK